MSAALLALQLLAASPSFAARAPAMLPAIDQPPDPDAPTWYGWQPLLADASAACMLGGAIWSQGQPGLQLGTSIMVVTGIGIYLFGGPGLHLARERPRTALIDLGVRLGFPLGGLLAGGILALVTQQSGWIAPGFAVGILLAIVIDVTGLSWEPPKAASAPVRWAPFAGAVRGSPVAGIAARF